MIDKTGLCQITEDLNVNFKFSKNKQKTKKLTKMFVHIFFSFSSPRQFENFEMKQGLHT